MEVAALENIYNQIRSSKSAVDHLAFMSALLDSHTPEAIRFHFNLLRERENKKLYHRLRAAFAKRGTAGEQFLSEIMETETDLGLKADALQLLGHIHSPAALPWARKLIDHENTDLRLRACIVLGWVGEAKDLASLGEAMLKDSDGYVRENATAAMMQMGYRLSDIKETALGFLTCCLEDERSENVVKTAVFAAQEMLGKKFGLKHVLNEEKNEIVGDVNLAKGKALHVLRQLEHL